MLPSGFDLVFRIFVTSWLVAISLFDYLHKRMPNWLVVPVAIGALIWQIVVSARSDSGISAGLSFALIAWVVLFVLWRIHIFGGGDAKLLMALFAMFPTQQFLVLFALVVLAVSIPLVVFKYAKLGWPGLQRGMRDRMQTKQILPTDEELRSRGRPYGWTLALPGVIYVWWLF
jgi:Flp pilus assembly protein protease CpaA